ncbi:MAG: type II secretion system GspH family protein [Planctomycetia bacterium]|nr:type II secretion system GspH family protein [Planctomycetia bacterium]
MRYSFSTHVPVRGASRAFAQRRGLTLLELVMVVSILAILTALVVPGMTNTQEETRSAVAKVSVQELRDVIADRYMHDMADSLGFQGLPRLHAIPGTPPTYPDTTRASTLGTTTEQLKYLPQLHFLFVNPRQYDATPAVTVRYAAIGDYDASTRLGWNGPYLMSKTLKYPNPEDARYPTDKNDTRKWKDFGFTTTFGQEGDYMVPDSWGSPIVISIQTTPHGGVLMNTAYVVSAGPNKTLDITSNTTTGVLTLGDDIALPLKSWK